MFGWGVVGVTCGVSLEVRPEGVAGDDGVAPVVTLPRGAATPPLIAAAGSAGAGLDVLRFHA